MDSLNPSPLDLCQCGDRRDQHEPHGGACRLNGLGHGYGGAACLKFRLARDGSGAPIRTEGNGNA